MKNNNIPNMNNGSKDIKKPTIKVHIIAGDNRNSSKIYKYTNQDGTNVYSGYYWDVWTLIEEKLKDKYTFEKSFSNDNVTNNDFIIKQTADGIYDLVIGQFFHLKRYENIITYTQPVVLNSTVIIHKKKDDTLTNITTLIWSLRYMFYYMVGFGLVIGLALWVFDRGRNFHLSRIRKAKNKNQMSFIRSLITGVSAMFGELGYLSENAKNSSFSFFLLVIICITAFVGYTYIQSTFTSKLLQIKEDSYYTSTNIPYNKCLSYRNAAETDKLQRYGIRPKYFDEKDISITDLIKKYQENSNKYDGVVTNYIDAQYIIKQFTDLTLSNNFGFEPISFIINQNLHKLKEDVNLSILTLRQDLILDNVCNKYYKDISSFVCSLV